MLANLARKSSSDNTNQQRKFNYCHTFGISIQKRTRDKLQKGGDDGGVGFGVLVGVLVLAGLVLVGRRAAREAPLAHAHRLLADGRQ